MGDVSLAFRAFMNWVGGSLCSLDFVDSTPRLWGANNSVLVLFLLLFVLLLIRTRRTGRREISPSEKKVVAARKELGERAEQAEQAPGVVPDVKIETAVTGAEPFQEEPEESFFYRLRASLHKTQDHFAGRLDRILLHRGPVDGDLLDSLEEVLLTSDLGTKTSYELLAELKIGIMKREISPGVMKNVLKEKTRLLLDVESGPLDPHRVRPFVIMLVGVNGVGKTTTAGKLAARLRKETGTVMLVAADTFRPAAMEQLRAWSSRIGADFIHHQPGADPSAVVFDGMQAAKSRGSDLVLVDTAGRLHTKKNLMDELKKVRNVMGRQIEGAPHEVLLVLDATTGQNAMHQAKMFHEAIGVTGIVLTKLDGTAKGGIVVGISNELRLPVRFVGIGEQVQDLREFNPRLFVDAIFGD